MTAMTVDAPSSATAPVARFAEGLVGFPDAHEYSLHGGEGGVFEMLPTEGVGPGFVVAAAGVFFPGYQPVLDDATAGRLGLEDADDALVLTIVTVGADVSAAHANLLAPVVVNTRTGVAEQVVLSGQDFPLRAPLGAH